METMTVPTLVNISHTDRTVQDSAPISEHPMCLICHGVPSVLSSTNEDKMSPELTNTPWTVFHQIFGLLAFSCCHFLYFFKAIFHDSGVIVAGANSLLSSKSERQAARQATVI